MVALSSVTNRLPVATTPRGPATGEVDGGFAKALATLGGGDDGDAPPPRQDDADAGKALPPTAADPAGPAALDPRLLWLPAGLLPAINTSVVKPMPQPLVPPQPVAVNGPGDALASQATVTPGQVGAAKTLAALATGDVPLPGKLADLFHAAQRIVTTQPPAQPMPVLAQPAPAITPTISTELAALGLDPTARDDRKKAIADPIAPPVTMTTEVALQNAVQPTGETRHVPLDLRGDTGLRKMIDHIETLRDGADANDTRIRLVPDALGTVDVAVRRDGAAVHVHFTAESADTRALLTEAQPRLVALAEQRGVRIAGASVDAGAGGGGNHAQPQRQPQSPIPNRISTTTPIEATGDDARLA